MINWDEISIVLLDMDGTLLDLHFDNYFWLHLLPHRYAEVHQMGAADAINKLESHFKLHEGTLNWYCLDFWSETLGIDILSLKKEARNKIAFRPHAIDFLNSLERAGKRKVIVTNAHRDSVRLKSAQTNLANWVDEIHSAHDFNAPKENLEFWNRMQSAEPFAAEQALLIDDNFTVLRTARQFGIGHLLTIHQPDSQGPVKERSEFVAIDSFNDIAPQYQQ